jgi:SAM-dependent methyltransferase
MAEVQRYPFKSSPYSSHAEILRLLPASGQGLRLLDLGCGPGHLSNRLAQRGFEVVAVDMASPERLDPGIHFVAADLNAAPLPALDGGFDFVLLADVVEHLTRPERILAWTRELLTSRGRIIISVPNVAHLYLRLKLLFGNFDPEPRGILDATHLHFYTRRSLLRLLEWSGFRVRRIAATAVPLELVVPRRLRGRVFRMVDAGSALMASLLPRLFAYQFVCDAEPAPRHALAICSK